MPTLADLTIKLLRQAADRERMAVWDVQNMKTKWLAIEGSWSAVSAWLSQEQQPIREFFGIPGDTFVGIFNTATLPMGWVRDNSFDNKFLRGAKSYGGSGGVTDHVHTRHTVIAHSHTSSFSAENESSHKHNYTRYASVAGASLGAGTQAWTLTATPNTVGVTHSHGLSGETASTGDSDPETSVPSTDLPPYIETIFANKMV